MEFIGLLSLSIFPTLINRKEMIFAIFDFIVLIFVISVISAPLEFLLNPNLGVRYGGIRGNENGMAYFAIFGLTLFEAKRLMVRNSWESFFWGGMILVTMFCIIITGSRGGFFSFCNNIVYSLLEGYFE